MKEYPEPCAKCQEPLDPETPYITCPACRKAARDAYHEALGVTRPRGRPPAPPKQAAPEKPKRRVRLTPEERRARNREYQREYQARRRAEDPEFRRKALKAAKAYRKTPAGRAARRKERRCWAKTPAGRAAAKRSKARARDRARIARIHAPSYKCPVLKGVEAMVRKLEWERQQAAWAQAREEKQRAKAARLQAQEARRQQKAQEAVARQARREASQRKQEVARAAKAEARAQREAQAAANRECPLLVELRKERQRAQSRDRMRQSYHEDVKEDPAKRLNLAVGNAVRSSLRKRRSHKGGRRWESVVGYTLAELKAHLEAQFREGMSWANYGEWHIDHIVPKFAFEFDSPDDPGFRECWALSNLQPLWASENWSKHATM